MTEDKKVRMAVLDLENNLVGYKVDSLWSLSEDPKHAKFHPKNDSGREEHLAENLLYLFNEARGGWFQRFPGGVTISVQDQDGEELDRYQVVRSEEGYQAK